MCEGGKDIEVLEDSLISALWLIVGVLCVYLRNQYAV